jgi:hypothetical protein
MKRLIAVALLAGMAMQGQDFKARAHEVVEFYARPKTARDSGYATVAAKLWLREDAATANRRLQEMLKDGPTGDMFWMFPITAVAYNDKGQLTPGSRAALRNAWKTYMPYRGDTENHWLLYYSSLYLAAQMWPGLNGDEWFNGKSSKENFDESREWIEEWMKTTTTKGQGEYDCTHYIGVFMLPMSYLAEWAEDARMKKQARMMIEWLMADYAAESLDGIYAGAHARTDDRMLVESWNSVSTDFGWLLFGQGKPTEPHAGYVLYYVLASAMEPPEILKRIATDRSKPYTHYEKKRTRNRWRLNDELHGPVYKTTYMTKDYAVGSDQGGVLQPVQQHSWDVTWHLDDPRGRHNTLFTVHPYSGMLELQAYFTFSPDFGTEEVYRSKKTYDSPDKLLGGSPFEKIAQAGDAVVVLYDIPPGTRFPHINGFFSKDLEEVAEDGSGWIFARGGRTRIAYRPLAPYEWKAIEGGGKRLFSPYLKNGAVVQAASVDEYPSAEAFRKAIVALPLEARVEPMPSVRFRTLRGRTMEFTYGETPRIDGKPLDYGNWPAFGGAMVEGKAGVRRMTMTHGGIRRVLDFDALTVEERPAR